ncbi:MAG: hypothetical protein ABJF10_03565 [Chthoniobacter sp.]|uniref:hypothetical protein n=1 Tax=Chthoniobacter sp. TaxID=2510640 RepID=UPI0032A46B7A
MYTRNGKIAHLPHAIREEINQRLWNGETGRSITDWLNTLPEVRTAMEAFFGGSEIREQNVSEWKQGGYEEWLRHQEALEVVKMLFEQGQELQGEAKDSLRVNEALSLWLSSRFVVATKEIAALDSEAAWKKQRQMCDDLMKLRRAEHRAAHLELQRREVQIEEERLEMERSEEKRRDRQAANKGAVSDVPEPEPDQRWEDISDDAKIAWARKPENLDRIKPPMTEEERIARMKEFLHIS